MVFLTGQEEIDTACPGTQPHSLQGSGFRGLGVRVLGFRGLGSRGLGVYRFRGLGFGQLAFGFEACLGLKAVRMREMQGHPSLKRVIGIYLLPCPDSAP